MIIAYENKYITIKELCKIEYSFKPKNDYITHVGNHRYIIFGTNVRIDHNKDCQDATIFVNNENTSTYDIISIAERIWWLISNLHLSHIKTIRFEWQSNYLNKIFKILYSEQKAIDEMNKTGWSMDTTSNLPIFERI